MTANTALVRAVASVCAPGTDAEALATVLAWACGPRRRPDTLRRRLRDSGHHADADAAAQLLAAVAVDGPIGEVVRRVALRVVTTWQRLDARVALVGDPAYPAALATGWPYVDAPVFLVWRGHPPGATGPGVALVGARNASAYGRTVTEHLATAVSQAGARVVSGGAMGIDAAAHCAALRRPGGTTVVLGCGHAVRYPAPHARPGGLFDDVLQHGGTLVSELFPEVTAHPGVIRARNRIVAGLSKVTVVVEGGSRSGALLTATAALDRGREVFAVPGDMLAPGSAAPLRLLSEGARVCTGAHDLLAALPELARAPSVEATDRSGTDAGGVVPSEIARLLAGAGARGLSIDELARASTQDTGALLGMLVRARVAGVVEDVPGGVRLRQTRSTVR